MAETIIRPGAPTSGRVTPASFPFYTTGEDNLRVTSYNAAAGVSLKINARTLDQRGIPTPDSWDHTPNTDRSAKSTDISLSGATPLNLTVFASAGAPLIGQTFVIVQLIRGIGAAAVIMGTMLQGYVTAKQAIGWPGSPIETSIEGGGVLRTIQATTPAAGANFAEAVPTGARWDLLCIAGYFSASAVAATRAPIIQLHRVTNGYVCSPTSATVIAGDTILESWAQGMPIATKLNSTYDCAGLPSPCLLLEGQSIVSFVGSIQAGDQWSQVEYVVREWLEVN